MDVSKALVERLQEGKKKAKGEFVPWHCRRGHVLSAHPKAVTVTCGRCARDDLYTGTCEAKRVDLYPNWPRKKKTIELPQEPVAATS